MAWIRDVAREPSLSPHWRWYAERKEVFLDGEGERFIDDPLSADDAWQQEVSQRDPSIYFIPKLTHFSNKNSGYAGNTLLGFLPYIKCPAGEEKNTRWPNHHRAVFHQAWYYIFRPFRFASKDGYSMQCGDTINRTLVIRFPILNNDLEEA
jgi:hypothetical protein